MRLISVHHDRPWINKALLNQFRDLSSHNPLKRLWLHLVSFRTIKAHSLQSIRQMRSTSTCLDKVMETAVVVILQPRCNPSILQSGLQCKQSMDRCLPWACHLRPAAIHISYILYLLPILSGTLYLPYFHPSPLESLPALPRRRTTFMLLLELANLTIIWKRTPHWLRNRVVIKEIPIRRRTVIGTHVRTTMLAMDAVIYTIKISLEIRKESTRTTEILNLGIPLTGISTPGAEITSTTLLFLYSTYTTLFYLDHSSQFSRFFTIVVTVNLYENLNKNPCFFSDDLR